MKKVFRLKGRDGKVYLVAAKDKQELHEIIMTHFFLNRPEEIRYTDPEEVIKTPHDIFLG